MGNVFISYARKDEAFVYPLDERLRQAGVTTWMDSRDIPPGVAWRQSIFDTIVACDAMLMCLSKNYVQSDMCRMESFIARSYGKRLIPIALDNCYSDLLQAQETKGLEDVHMLEFFSHQSVGLPLTEDEIFKRLLNALTCPEPNIPDNLVYLVNPREEAVLATQIANDLQGVGINTWISTRDNVVGYDWQKQQWSAMMQAKALVVVLTPKSAASEHIRRQVLFARTRHLPMFPIVPEHSLKDAKEQTLPQILDATYETRLLNEIYWLYIKPDYATMLQQLQASLERYL